MHSLMLLTGNVQCEYSILYSLYANDQAGTYLSFTEEKCTVLENKAMIEVTTTHIISS